jgi:hypothetical protein
MTCLPQFCGESLFIIISVYKITDSFNLRIAEESFLELQFQT